MTDSGSVFREQGWRTRRHLLNPSKRKEYELHAAGLGFLNRLNFFRDYYEKFTPLDSVTDEAIRSLHKKTTLHLIRQSLSEEEKNLLVKHDFHLKSTWGTLILDTTRPLQLDGNTTKNIRKGEDRLIFMQITDEHDFKEYHALFKSSRKELGFRTPAYSEFRKIFNSPFYKVFAAKDKETGALVAGLGTIVNNHYLLEVNAARDKKIFFANDFLKHSIIRWCRDQGIGCYDFAGCNPDPTPGSKDANLRAYKEKWGGTYYAEYIFRRT